MNFRLIESKHVSLAAPIQPIAAAIFPLIHRFEIRMAEAIATAVANANVAGKSNWLACENQESRRELEQLVAPEPLWLVSTIKNGSTIPSDLAQQCRRQHYDAQYEQLNPTPRAYVSTDLTKQQQPIVAALHFEDLSFKIILK